MDRGFSECVIIGEVVLLLCSIYHVAIRCLACSSLSLSPSLSFSLTNAHYITHTCVHTG